MSAPYWYLEEKLEDAIKSYIVSSDDPNDPINVGFAGDDIVEPFVGIGVLQSDRAEPEQGPVSDGTREAEVTIRIQSHAEDNAGTSMDAPKMRDRHKLLKGRVLDLMYDSAIVTMLNAQSVPDFNVERVEDGLLTRSIQGHSFVTEQRFKIVCKPSS